MKPLLNKIKLFKRVHEKHFKNLSFMHVQRIINALFLEINTAFINHEDIQIKNFGSFRIIKSKRKGRNVVAGKPIYFKNKIYRVKFRLGRRIKDILKQQKSEE